MVLDPVVQMDIDTRCRPKMFDFLGSDLLKASELVTLDTMGLSKYEL